MSKASIEQDMIQIQRLAKLRVEFMSQLPVIGLEKVNEIIGITRQMCELRQSIKEKCIAKGGQTQTNLQG